jgi:hypothetical protein
MTQLREYNISNTKCWEQGFIAAFICGGDTHSFSVAADFLAS